MSPIVPSLSFFFFCTFFHSLSLTLKCCIQLAKPGKLPLVSVNQEKNSGTHILMITELGKKCLSTWHQYFLLFWSWCFQLSLAFPPFISLAVTERLPHGTALNAFYLWLWLELTVLFWPFLNDFFPHTASVNLWSHPSDLAVASKASLL